MGLAVPTAGTAFAVTVYPPEGGHWWYNMGPSATESEYLHDTKKHGASAKGRGDAQLVRSTCRAAGYYATAVSKHGSGSGVARAYYRLC
ncbi:lactococcin 972 family bacteriocin [Isoptericola croceus]|uniref:lactococcin 972 family bacteriocin n=1 Tax=Isoptericola croceus TaxID=3031406 RepID=UPI0034D72EA2